MLDRYLHDKIWQYTRETSRKDSQNSTAAKAAGRSCVAPEPVDDQRLAAAHPQSVTAQPSGA